MRAQIGGWHNTSAEELVREITAFYRLRRHNEVVDAIILAALESNLVACREVAKHFKCPYLTGHSVTPDGAVVLEDGTVVALDVTVIGDLPPRPAKSAIVASLCCLTLTLKWQNW